MNQMGYACINTHLSNSKPKVTTNRSMIKRTFTEKGFEFDTGIHYIGECRNNTGK